MATLASISCHDAASTVLPAQELCNRSTGDEAFPGCQIYRRTLPHKLPVNTTSVFVGLWHVLRELWICYHLDLHVLHTFLFLFHGVWLVGGLMNESTVTFRGIESAPTHFLRCHLHVSINCLTSGMIRDLSENINRGWRLFDFHSQSRCLPQELAESEHVPSQDMDTLLT